MEKPRRKIGRWILAILVVLGLGGYAAVTATKPEQHAFVQEFSGETIFDEIDNEGFHLRSYFLNGESGNVLAAMKRELLGRGWSVSPTSVGRLPNGKMPYTTYVFRRGEDRITLLDGSGFERRPRNGKVQVDEVNPPNWIQKLRRKFHI